MIPLVPTLALALLSFVSSVFVVLRIVIPILPPGPFSNRVAPSEFGLPNFKALSPADKSHIWLAVCDLVALTAFIWQAVEETKGSKSDWAVTTDAFGTGRMWLALTLRQTCLFVVAGITLLHVRLGRPVSFGSKHWILALPTAVLMFTSTGVASTLAGANMTTFFLGMVAYSSTLAAFSSVAFGCLIGTLLLIRRNLARLDAKVAVGPWRAPSPFVEEKNRPSFAAEDIEHLKDGASWITSPAASRRESLVSAFSYTTRHTRHASLTSSLRHHLAENSSRQIKPSTWFPAATPPHGHTGLCSPAPPVPPLPEQYRSRTPSAYLNDDADPFARTPTPTVGVPQRNRPIGSQTSWLTSESGSQTTLTAWSYPTASQRPVSPAATDDSHRDIPEREPQTTLRPSTATRPITPAMDSTQVLGGYGFTAEKMPVEKHNVSTSTNGDEVDISVYRAIGWLVTIWVPLGLAFPYLLMTTARDTIAPQWASILLVLSVTMSSPILALNIFLFHSPLPIPSDLFDSYSEPPSVVHRAPSPASSGERITGEYKRSASVTIVEGRRSGDVWLTNGDAINAKSKIGRALNMIGTKPKLSVMPVAPLKLDGTVTPPIPIPAEEPFPATPTTANSENNEFEFELERKRKKSKASSYYSGATEHVQQASRIMIAQRHYSAVATTVIVPPSPEQSEGRKSPDTDVDSVRFATGVAFGKDETPKGHLRTRSVSSMNGSRSPISPPPASPLPPTPPTLKNARAAQLIHRRASTLDFSFGAIEAENTREIDALSAGVLPILITGMEVGQNVRIKDFAPALPRTNASTKSKKRLSGLRDSMTSMEFGTPEGASTPKKGKLGSLKRSSSGHKRGRFSLPGLGRDSLNALVGEVNGVIQGTNVSYSSVATEDGRHPTVVGVAQTMGPLHAVREESFSQVIERPASIAALLEQVPPPSASSEVTLFDPDASGPQAQSTPHESRVARPRSQSPAPLLPVSRRSSIQYFPPDAVVGAGARRASIASRSGLDSENDAPAGQTRRVVRPKPSRLQAVQEAAVATDGYAAVPSSPGGGIRPLTLLRDRDVNASPTTATRPLLLLGNKKKTTRKADAENAGLKPLALTRSDTAKERGILRKTEVLPTVVVRPPSTGDEVGYDMY